MKLWIAKVMIQKQKELLLKDLCARLPYRVMCRCDKIKVEGVLKEIGINYNMCRLYDSFTDESEDCYIFDCKPYLFPLSSMTKEQKKELENLGWHFDNFEINNVCECLGTYREYVAHLDCFVLIDWLNKNHFDYRGLIEQGLAIDATDKNIY